MQTDDVMTKLAAVAEPPQGDLADIATPALDNLIQYYEEQLGNLTSSHPPHILIKLRVYRYITRLMEIRNARNLAEEAVSTAFSMESTPVVIRLPEPQLVRTEPEPALV